MGGGGGGGGVEGVRALFNKLDRDMAGLRFETPWNLQLLLMSSVLDG